MNFEQYEPKRENRFFCEIKELGKLKSYLIRNIDRPSYNIITKLWDDIEVNFIDVIALNASKNIFETYIEGDETNCNLIIDILDPTGESLEKWSINSKLKKIVFSGFDYESNEHRSIKLIIKPEKCSLV